MIKDIKGFEDYQITDDGKVWSKKSGKFLKAWLNNTGYEKVMINKKKCLIHRLVAETFIPNPENKPYIDHINPVRTDNRAENLRWCTPKENMNNSNTIEKLKNRTISEEHKKKISDSNKGKISPRRKPIYQYSLEVELIKIWSSKMELEKNGIYNVSKVCNGKRKTANGYIWRWN